MPIAGAVLLIAAGPTAPVNRRLLSHPVAVWIGLISYPLYLWHWPLLSYAQIVAGSEPGKLARSVAVAAAIVLAWLTYRCVEQSLRGARSRLAVTGLAVGMAAIGLGAMSIYAHGASTRLGQSELPSSQSREVFTASRSSSNDTCQRLLGLDPVDEEVCLTNAAQPTVLFAGDSHAMALYSALFTGSVQAPAMLISGHDCEVYPTLSYTPTHEFTWRNNCTAIAAAVLEAARQIRSIHTIVLAPAAREASQTRVSVYRSGTTPLSEHDALVQGTDDFLASLAQLGKDVIYLRDVPRFTRSPTECVQRLPHLAPPDCRIERATLLASRAEYRQAVDEVAAAHSEVRFIDPTALFCQQRYCDERDPGGYLYQDNHHLSLYGSDKVLRTYLPDVVTPASVRVSAATDGRRP